ncbi:MAG: glycosyltransferase family 87 protein [Vicinamibacterales bacterium]
MTSLLLVLAACLCGPPLVVGLTAIGIPWQVSAAIVSAVAAVVLARTVRQARSIGASRLHWPALLTMLVVLAAATFYTARLSLFMFDATRADLSVFPNRPFFRTHSCVSAYTEAARLAPSGANIYDVALYSDPAKPGENLPRYIGPLEADLYQYPPPFLVLPASGVRFGLDLFTIRRVWFAVQSVVLLIAMVVLARWVGGRSGLLALLLVPFVWIAPTTRLGLQLGNFQLTAVPMAMLAMIAFARGHDARGGFALGFPIVSKIFPGLLGVQLLVERRWRAIAWTVAWAGAFTVAAWLTVGSTPFVDFVRYQLPRIESGEAFFWMNAPEVAPINFGVHGLVIKLRYLGGPFTGALGASRVATVYALLLLPIALIAVSRLRALTTLGLAPELVRLRQTQVWLGLLSLASFRSPFVPDAYALVATLWLVTLVAAEGHWRVPGRLALVAAGVATMIVLDGGVIKLPVPTWIMVATLVWQIAAIAFNAAIVLTPGRGAARPAAPVPA